jgi:NTP pyrophosphatase (non-canonical NTP hydrolase)
LTKIEPDDTLRAIHKGKWLDMFHVDGSTVRLVLFCEAVFCVTVGLATVLLSKIGRYNDARQPFVRADEPGPVGPIGPAGPLGIVGPASSHSFGDVLRDITDANPTKHHGNLIRRIMKQMEELGEAAEAYLNVTSAANGKGMTWDDVREELADQVIVAVDCALTPTPDQVEAGLTREQVEQEFANVVGRKLAKWRSNRDTGKAATDAE